MGPRTTASRTLSLAVIAAIGLSCAPPPPAQAPTREQATQAPKAGTARIDDAHDLHALALPEALPATVYTRTAPTSLVDERGTPLQVFTGHHTRLELLHIFKDRAQVACRLCPTPAEGWVQINMIMPSNHDPSPGEQEDERLALALYAASLRYDLEQGGSFPNLQPTNDQRTLLLRLLDQGFAREERDAIAPASGGAYAQEGASIKLRLGPDGWRVHTVELPPAVEAPPVH